MNRNRTTDTNQASEDRLIELATKFDMDEYGTVNENGGYLIGEVRKLIRTEKLKLLAEVKERVIGENNSEDSKRFDSDTGACDGCDWFIEDGSDVCPCVLKNRLREVQRTELTKLEAEL